MHIVLNLGPVIMVNRGRGVVERSQQVCLDVANFGGAPVKPFKAVFDMGLVELEQAAFDNLGWLIFTIHPEKWLCGTNRVMQYLYDFIYALFTILFA